MGVFDLERAAGLLPALSLLRWVGEDAFNARGRDLASFLFVFGAGSAVEAHSSTVCVEVECRCPIVNIYTM